jgi:hypothetical protein
MLEQHKDNLEKILINLVLEMRREIEKFSATEYGFVLDEYLVGARDTKKKYIHGILTLEDKINESKDMLYEEFGEMKKLEIALEKQE